MKDTETKRKFIRLRAEGKSYTTISKELGVSRTTCKKWESVLGDQIEELKREALEELYTSFGMTKEARINKLGALLSNIDAAITSKNFSELSLDRLLELRLKYGRELQTEYREPARSSDNTLDGILEEYNKLYEESRSGSLTASDIKAQLDILDAKKEALYKIDLEKRREKYDGFNIELNYTSNLIRHKDGEAV